MLVGSASFPHILSVESVLPSSSQVCIRKLSSSYNFEVCLCRVINPFARLTSRASSLAWAEALTHRCQAQSTPSSLRLQGERSGVARLQDLQALKEILQQQDDDLHSYDEGPAQGLQNLKGFLDQQAETQPREDGRLEQQRPPKAATGGPKHSKTEPMQGSSVRNQLGTQSEAVSSGSSSKAASSGSPHLGKRYERRDIRASKHRGRRIPARGLDVLDKLMVSQGHTSRALLESLQATVPSDDDGNPDAHYYGKDTPKVHPEDRASAFFSGKASSYERASIDTWTPPNDITTDSKASSSTFASSIEKALSPSIASNRSSSAPASSTNRHVLEQKSTLLLSSQAYSAGDSDTAKPSLRGQEVLLALQKAAIEKAKVKQRTRKVSDRASKPKQEALHHEPGEWRDAKPIIVRPEWAQQIDELERRIENFKNSMQSL